MIRTITATEIPELIQLQLRTLPGSLASRFGGQFMHVYYETLLPDPDFFCDGWYVDDQLIGFIVYSSDSRGVLQKAFRQNLLAYSKAILFHIFRQPGSLSSIFRVAKTLFSNREGLGDDIPAEMISIGVIDKYRGVSTSSEYSIASVGFQLTDNGLDQLKNRDVRRVKLYTKLEDESPVANAFVRKLGFQLLATEQVFGDLANLYVRDL